MEPSREAHSKESGNTTLVYNANYYFALLTLGKRFTIAMQDNVRHCLLRQFTMCVSQHNVCVRAWFTQEENPIQSNHKQFFY